MIWEFNRDFDVVITAKQFRSLPPAAKDYVTHFAYLNANEGGYVLCSDNGKYFNHSLTPNCIASGVKTVAAKDINAGEEIVENYFTFDELANQKLSQ